VLAGWAGCGTSRGRAVGQVRLAANISRLLVFKLGGTAKLPPRHRFSKRVARPARFHGHCGASGCGAGLTSAIARFCMAMPRSRARSIPTSGVRG